MKTFPVIVILLLSPSFGFAAPCELEEGKKGFVQKVIDGDTLVLKSGDVVRLVGLQSPKLPLGRKNFPVWPLAPLSKSSLEKLVLNKEVLLKYGGRKVDRHGRKLAHVFVKGRWVQEQMIKKGMARVYSFPDNRACVEDLMAIERDARKTKTGIWQRPFYKVRRARDIESLSLLHNTFQLVSGKVLSVGEAKGKIYLNFGREWKKDFTAIIPRHHQKYFKKASFNVKELAGKKVRIRGWLGFHNGPTVDLSHPEQIETIGQ